MYFPNGYNLVKREYLVQVENSEPVDFINESGVAESKTFSATGAAFRQYVTMSDESKIQMNLEYVGNYPVTVTGYKLKTAAGATSGEYSVGDDHNIVFDRNFLKNNESNYCFKTQLSSTSPEYNAFSVIPIVKKQAVTYSIDASNGGTINL